MDHNCCVICENPPTLSIDLPCEHVACFLCLKGVVFDKKTKCPTCNKKYNDEVLLQMVDVDDMDKINIQPVEQIDRVNWLYSLLDKDSWWMFDPKTNIIVEDLYQEYLMDIDYNLVDHPVEISNKKYYYDFYKNLQISDDNKKRRIDRKINLEYDSVKGIAGIKYKDIIVID